MCLLETQGLISAEESIWLSTVFALITRTRPTIYNLMSFTRYNTKIVLNIFSIYGIFYIYTVSLSLTHTYISYVQTFILYYWLKWMQSTKTFSLPIVSKHIWPQVHYLKSSFQHNVVWNEMILTCTFRTPLCSNHCSHRTHCNRPLQFISTIKRVNKMLFCSHVNISVL